MGVHRIKKRNFVSQQIAFVIDYHNKIKKLEGKAFHKESIKQLMFHKLVQMHLGQRAASSTDRNPLSTFTEF